MRRRLGIGAVVAAISLSTTIAFADPATERKQVATCETGPVMNGPGPANWRRVSRVAGSVAVFRGALQQMSETPNGQLTRKMPALTIGHQPVTLSAPPYLRHRVFLYYGFHEGPDGRRTTAMAGFPGYHEVEFHPCTNRPRTPWPGGIRIKGRAPVHLDVIAADGATDVLRLGRPKPYEPPTS
jgi:hypothetical protein